MKIEERIKAEIAKLKTDKPDGWEQQVQDYEDELAEMGDFIKTFRKNVKDEQARKTEDLKAKLTEANEKLAEFEKLETEKKQKEMINNGEQEKLIDTLKNTIKEQDEKLKVYVEKETERIEGVKHNLSEVLEKIPADNQRRIPDYDDPEKKLNWINDNKDILGIGDVKRLPNEPGTTPPKKTDAPEQESEHLWDGPKSKARQALKEGIESGELLEEIASGVAGASGTVQ